MIGVDSCAAGWSCVRENNGSLECFIVPNLNQLFEQFYGETIAIDIPMGLTATGPRLVDQLARRILGPRKSSVFPTPIRPTLYANNREAASAIGEQVDGRRLSKQTWSIVPKVRELDVLLQAERQLLDMVHECHPEVCWTAMNGGVPLNHNKKCVLGREERLALVQQHFGPIGLEIYCAAIQQYRRRDVACDDILDSLACLWTAMRIEKDHSTPLLQQPVYDPLGIPMQIAF